MVSLDSALVSDALKLENCGLGACKFPRGNAFLFLWAVLSFYAGGSRKIVTFTSIHLIEKLNDD